jgi:hypothetical protein
VPLLQDKWLSNQYHNNASRKIAYFDDIISFHKDLVSFQKAGVPMVAGTDAGTSGVVTGFSLHDGLLVDAGQLMKH